MPKLPSNRKQLKALDILETEVTNWFDAIVDVTDSVQFTMRERIKRARKNYWGVFDVQYDPAGNEKKWYPLTQWFADLFARYSDLDTKDINIKGKRAESQGAAAILRYIVRHFVERLNFAHLLNDFIRRLIIDGTAVNRTMPGKGDQIVNTKNVDLLNFITDPSSESLHDSAGNTEVTEMLIDEFMSYTSWENKEKILEQIPEDTTTVPKVRVYTRWGKLPEYLLKKDMTSNGNWVESVLVAAELVDSNTFQGMAKSSDLIEETKGTKRYVMKMAKSPLKRRPFEEGWFIKVPGRWYGMGIPEMLFDLQELANENLNIRHNNGRILKNGLFKIKKGSGITPQMIAKLSSGGGIPVRRSDDFEQMPITDYRASSYEDEDRLNLMAQKLLGASAPASGEALPSTTTATVGLINQQNVATSFDIIKENVGNAVKRIIQYHFTPIIVSKLSVENIYRITGSKEEINGLTDSWAQKQVDTAILKSLARGGKLPTVEEQGILKDAVKKTLAKGGKDRFISDVRKEMFNEEYDYEVFTTNESFDKATTLQQLRQAIVELPQIPGIHLNVEELAKEYLDMMGIGGERFITDGANEVQNTEKTGVSRRAQETPIDRTLNQRTEQPQVTQ